MVRRREATDALVLRLAAGVVAVQGGVMAAVRRVNRVGPLRRLRAWLARQSPARALPMFLVPEVTSRCGTLASAWLLLQGDAGRALAVYAASKLCAGLVALWVYSACEPALLRIRWFAWLHGEGMRLTSWLLARCQPPGRFAAAVTQIRARSSAPAPAPATPAAPTARGRTG